MKQKTIERLERNGYIIVGRKRIRPNSPMWWVLNVGECLTLFTLIIALWGIMWAV